MCEFLSSCVVVVVDFCLFLEGVLRMQVGLGLMKNRKHLTGTDQTTTTTAKPTTQTAPVVDAHPQIWENGIVNPSDIVNPEARRWSGASSLSNDVRDELNSAHVPHSICTFHSLQIISSNLTNRPKCNPANQHAGSPAKTTLHRSLL